MQRWLIIVAWFFTITVGSAVGYWYGLREGWQLGLMSEAAPRGVLATGNLNAIKAGKTETVVTLLELDVDQGLYWSYQLSQHPLVNFFEPVWGLRAYPSNEQYIIRLANYRKTHPSPFKTDVFDTVPPGHEKDREFYKQLAEQSRENALDNARDDSALCFNTITGALTLVTTRIT